MPVWSSYLQRRSPPPPACRECQRSGPPDCRERRWSSPPDFRKHRWFGALVTGSSIYCRTETPIRRDQPPFTDSSLHRDSWTGVCSNQKGQTTDVRGNLENQTADFCGKQEEETGIEGKRTRLAFAVEEVNAFVQEED
ncbi:hypothetical protein Fot_11759 [Forsythia ovata]|uniref:Uncharacterized protein n=1 Tax=Forsythia ovata TaxID=205694 RepID=A0ABD1WKL5_9LAMI